MRRLVLLITLIFVGYSLKAQTAVPPGIAYQAVAIKPSKSAVAGFNPDGLYWTNRDISVRFTIFEKWPGGTNQYSEIHDLRTDAFGTFGCIIGQGTIISGDFNTIPWSLGTAHLQVEIDYFKDGDYSLIGVERFWSVPYAMLSNNASNSVGADDVYLKSHVDSLTNLLLGQIQYLKNRDKDTAIGNDGVSNSYVDSQYNSLLNLYMNLKNSDQDTVVGNELQIISRSQDTVFLSRNGGFITLPSTNKTSGFSDTPSFGKLANVIYGRVTDSVKCFQLPIQTIINHTIYKDSIYLLAYEPLGGYQSKANLVMYSVCLNDGKSKRSLVISTNWNYAKYISPGVSYSIISENGFVDTSKYILSFFENFGMLKIDVINYKIIKSNNFYSSSLFKTLELKSGYTNVYNWFWRFSSYGGNDSLVFLEKLKTSTSLSWGGLYEYNIISDKWRVAVDSFTNLDLIGKIVTGNGGVVFYGKKSIFLNDYDSLNRCNVVNQYDPKNRILTKDVIKYKNSPEIVSNSMFIAKTFPTWSATVYYKFNTSLIGYDGLNFFLNGATKYHYNLISQSWLREINGEFNISSNQTGGSQYNGAEFIFSDSQCGAASVRYYSQPKFKFY
jgi:hypothetical protein